MRSKAIQLLTILLVVMFAVSMGMEAAQQAPAAGTQGGGVQRGGGPGGGGPGGGGGQGGAARGGRGGGGPGLALTSPSWQDGSEIPAKHAGQMGVSPALSWANAPMGTVEYALIMNDPEPVTPRGSATGDILHWLIVKIPATATSLAEGTPQPALPQGARQIQTYRGPGAPAAGPRHHYTITLYALNAPLELAETATRADVMAAMEGKVLARGIFGGRFQQAPAQ